MSDFPFPEIPDDEPDAGGGGGAVTINGQPIDVDVVAGSISIDPGDIEIGAVEIKDGTTNARAAVLTADPAVGDPGIVVRIAGGAVGGGLTDTQLRASPVPISGAVTVSDGSGPLTIDGVVSVTGSVAVTGPATDTQLRATPLPVSGTVVTGGLTDTQLRATPVPISGAVTVSDGSGPLTVDGTVGISGSVAVTGPLTDAQLRATSVDVNITGGAGSGLTDTQLRATPVPISGAVTVSDGSGPLTVDGTVAITGSVAVTGPLTDTQLRATAVPVSGPATDAELRATPLPVSGTVIANAGAGPFPVSDNAGSLTVDAPVGTPVFVRLSDGAAPVAPLTDTQLRATPPGVFLTSPAQAPYGIGAKAGIFGSIQALGLPTPLIFDQFESGLDTTNRWTTSGTVPPTIVGNSISEDLGAVNSASSVLVSQPTIAPITPLTLGVNLTLGAQQTNPNAHRFFGMGVVTGFTAANPVTDGFGFEVDLTGALNAVVYVAGVRYVVNSTNPALITAPGGWAAGMTMSNFGANLTYPASGIGTFIVQYVNGSAYFFMSNGSASAFDVPAGVASWTPTLATLPIRIHNITTPAVSTVLATTFRAAAVALLNQAASNITVSDPTNPWRQQAVDSAGRASVLQPDVQVTGTITTQNLVPAGVATANSAVLSGNLDNGVSTGVVQVTGTYTGALSLQYTVDGTTWVTMGTTNAVFYNLLTGVYTTTIVSATQSIFQFQAAGVKQVRVTGLAAMTGTATITMRFTSNVMPLPNLNGINTIVGVTTVTTLTGTTTLTPGTGAANLGKGEDLPHTTGDVGVMALFVRQDSQSALAGNTLDYIPGTTDSVGNLRVIAGVSTSSAGLGKLEDSPAADGDTGIAVFGVRRDTEGTNVSAPGDYAELDVDALNRLRVVAAPNPVTATQANVAGSATSVTLIAANAARRGWAITNDSTQILYVKLGTTASLTSYYEAIPAATATQIFTLESQPGISFQGDITGIMPSANGNARTTEFVAA